MYERWDASRLGRITNRLEYHLLFDSLPPLKGREVLDVGCGNGEFMVRLHSEGAKTVTGSDADAAMLAAAASRLDQAGIHSPLVEAPADSLPFEDDTFDVVTAITILCFVQDAHTVFREIARVLKPGGCLVIGELGRYSTWAASRRVRAWFGSELWRAAYFRTPSELQELAEAAGLQVKLIRGGVYYPPVGILAQVLAPIDPWLGRRTTFGAAFLSLVAEKPDLTYSI